MKLNSLQKEYMYKLYAMCMTFALSYLNFSVYTSFYKTSDLNFMAVFLSFSWTSSLRVYVLKRMLNTQINERKHV